MRIAVVLLMGIFVFSSCSNFDKEVEKREIMSLLQQQSLDWNTGNIEAYMQGYWKSETLRFASGDRVTFGWEKTFNNYKKSYPDKLSMGKLVFTEITVEILNENSALVFGRWQLYRETDVPHGLFTLHLHKFQEGWKIVSDHTSSGK